MRVGIIMLFLLRFHHVFGQCSQAVSSDVISIEIKGEGDNLPSTIEVVINGGMPVKKKLINGNCFIPLGGQIPLNELVVEIRNQAFAFSQTEKPFIDIDQTNRCIFYTSFASTRLVDLSILSESSPGVSLFVEREKKLLTDITLKGRKLNEVLKIK